jgi:hypothetical protein
MEWQSEPINTRNIHRFLTENGYVKYRAKTQNGMMILRYRDNNMPWCADIELDIEMNGQQTPPITVAGVTPILTNQAKLIIEQLYNWSELREFISQLHGNKRMGSYVFSPHDEITLAADYKKNASFSTQSKTRAPATLNDDLDRLHSRLMRLKQPYQ